MFNKKGVIRILKSGAAIVAAISLCAAPVYADYEISYGGGDAPFHIAGNTGIEKQNLIVTLKVSDDENNILYIKQTTTDADGSYSFAFETGKDGMANVLVMEEDTEATGQKQIYKSSEEEIKDVIDRLNSSSEDIGSVITEECVLLGVDPEEYGDLKSNRIFLSYLEDRKYEDLNDFSEAYRAAKFLVMVDRNEPAEELKELGDRVLDEADLKERNAGDTFDNLSDAEKLKIYKELGGGQYKTVKSFYDDLCEKVILKEIAAVKNYNDKYSVIADNNDYIDLDLDSVSKLGNKKESFKKEFAEALGSVKSVEDIRKKFKEIYGEYKGSPSGGGGSSSGGGGGGSYQVNRDLVPDIDYPERSYFKDLDGYDWAKEAIVALATKGIVRGREDLIFVPGDNITRAEFVKIITAAFTLPDAADGSGEDFADVSKDFWGYDYIMAAKRTGIVKGISETEFNPGGYITRQDMAVICRRIFSILDKDLSAQRNMIFADEESISSYAKDSVYELANAGIINGKGNNSFDPYGNATRAEAAQMVYGILKAIS